MDIELALIVDILLLISSLWLILQVSKPSIFNPSLWWVALHAYTVTSRLIALNRGAESLAVIGIRDARELVNAAIASDVSLLAVVAGTILISSRTYRVVESVSARNSGIRLSPRVGQIISILCLTIGTCALIEFGYFAIGARARGIDVSAINIGQFEDSSYPITIAGFAVQGALIQCALRGFNRWTVSLLLILLALTAFNLPRSSAVLAILMAFLIYQTRSSQHTLPLRWTMGLVLLGLVWFVFKPIVGGVIAGKDLRTVSTDVQDYIETSGDTKGSIDTQFFDMQATYMAAADEAGRRFYGATTLPLFYLPIPRFVWPDKPRQNDAALELSTESRQIAQVGMVPTLSGESYINFGWMGCAVIPFLYILGMQIACRRVSSYDITSAARWVYLIMLISMLQIFRDGLNSLVLFPLVAYLPLLGWGVISRLLTRGRRTKNISICCAVHAVNQRPS